MRNLETAKNSMDVRLEGGMAIRKFPIRLDMGITLGGILVYPNSRRKSDYLHLPGASTTSMLTHQANSQRPTFPPRRFDGACPAVQLGGKASRTHPRAPVYSWCCHQLDRAVSPLPHIDLFIHPRDSITFPISPSLQIYLRRPALADILLVFASTSSSPRHSVGSQTSS